MGKVDALREEKKTENRCFPTEQEMNHGLTGSACMEKCHFSCLSSVKFVSRTAISCSPVSVGIALVGWHKRCNLDTNDTVKSEVLR